ncbi:alpha/beta fold hydrolase [Pseudarthrobacter sp. NPDC055928]|uniref:alpha/beta fold hydrolase n=1 Tax=Pseudarthrobacter sp. NPDC055928 TaxID=3345661 RepID=UPI0035DB5CDA
MTTFVLVHGSWHDGSAWQPVIEALEAAGHSAFGPTLAGHGAGADKNVNHDDCVWSIINYITEHDLNDFVLVGHSFGGTVIARVAEEIPDRIRRLVFWSAFVLPAGTSLRDELPPHYRTRFDQMASESADHTVDVVSFDLWRESFIGDADLEAAQASFKTLSPEPYQPFKDLLDLTRFYQLTTPRSYLVGTEDIAIPPGEDSWHPRHSSRLGNYRLVQMPGSHELLFSNPVGLAGKIVEAGRD